MKDENFQNDERPFLTASTAAKELGYAGNSYLSVLCNAGKIPGAYKQGRIWLVPVAWVQAKKEENEKAGIVRNGKFGRPVTTGAGLNRKRPAYVPTGRPKGRPKKNPEQD